jgi:ankyrin repeat protein
VVRRNEFSKIAEMVNTVYVDVLNNRWESPLIAAAQSGRVACITALLGHGARVDNQDRHGNTALHYVAMRHHMKATEALVAGNADCNILNCDGSHQFTFS